MKNVKIWLKGARLYTLPIGLVPVVMAFATASRMIRFSCFIGTGDHLWQCIFQTLLCAAVAAFMQISVNYANDYCDGLNGLDENRKLRDCANSNNSKPLCDVSFRLTDAGMKPKSVLNAVIISALIACVFGLIIVFNTGIWWFIPIGILCLTAAWFYAGGKHPYGYNGWGEVSSFVFFGSVPFIGSLCAISYGMGIASNNISINNPVRIFYCILLSFIPGAYSACLMMVNNLRDVESDKKHGKITAMIKLGELSGKHVCVAVNVLAMCLLLAYSVLTIAFPSYVPSIWRFYKHEDLTTFSMLVHNAPYCLLFVAFQWFILIVLLRKVYKFVKCILNGDYKNAFPLCVSQAMLGAAAVLMSAII